MGICFNRLKTPCNSLTSRIEMGQQHWSQYDFCERITNRVGFVVRAIIHSIATFGDVVISFAAIITVVPLYRLGWGPVVELINSIALFVFGLLATAISVPAVFLGFDLNYLTKLYPKTNCDRQFLSLQAHSWRKAEKEAERIKSATVALAKKELIELLKSSNCTPLEHWGAEMSTPGYIATFEPFTKFIKGNNDVILTVAQYNLLIRIIKLLISSNVDVSESFIKELLLLSEIKGERMGVQWLTLGLQVCKLAKSTPFLADGPSALDYLSIPQCLWRSVHRHASLEGLALIYEKGCKICFDSLDTDGNTPLMLWCKDSQSTPATLAALINYGVNPAVYRGFGQTAFRIATDQAVQWRYSGANLGKVKFLAAFESPIPEIIAGQRFSPKEIRESAIGIAISHNFLSTVDRLLSIPRSYEQTPEEGLAWLEADFKTVLDRREYSEDTVKMARVLADYGYRSGYHQMNAGRQIERTWDAVMNEAMALLQREAEHDEGERKRAAAEISSVKIGSKELLKAVQQSRSKQVTSAANKYLAPTDFGRAMPNEIGIFSIVIDALGPSFAEPEIFR